MASASCSDASIIRSVLWPFLNKSPALVDIRLRADAGSSASRAQEVGDGGSSGRGEGRRSASGVLIISQASQQPLVSGRDVGLDHFRRINDPIELSLRHETKF